MVLYPIRCNKQARTVTVDGHFSPLASTAASATSSAPRSKGLNRGEVSVKAAAPTAAGGGASTGTGETALGEAPEASNPAGLQ